MSWWFGRGQRAGLRPDPTSAVIEPSSGKGTVGAPLRGVPLSTPTFDGQEWPAAADLQAAWFTWLLAVPTDTPMWAQADERRWLEALDRAMGPSASPADWVPRAAGVVPQLLGTLRDEHQSAHVLAQHVARDPHLVAEVTRLAHSAAHRATTPSADLSGSIQRIGTSGVRQAIARVVMRPVFAEAHAGPMARVGPVLWEQAQRQARVAQALASAQGDDSFAAYLGGLLSNVGWMAGLRALERATGAGVPPGLPGAAFLAAFARRRDRLFARWLLACEFGGSLAAAADAILAAGSLAAAREPLAQHLYRSQQLTAWAMLSEAGSWSGASVATAALPADIEEALNAALDGA